MNIKQVLRFFLIIAFTLVSCNPSTQFDGSKEVSLESKKEIFSTSEEVQLMLINDTNKDLYLNYCGPTLFYKLEAKVNENWVNYASGRCQAVYVPEFISVLEPDETQGITFDSLDVGQYRYNLAYKLSSSDSDSQEISIQFLVH